MNEPKPMDPKRRAALQHEAMKDRVRARGGLPPEQDPIVAELLAAHEYWREVARRQPVSPAVENTWRNAVRPRMTRTRPTGTSTGSI